VRALDISVSPTNERLATPQAYKATDGYLGHLFTRGVPSASVRALPGGAATDGYRIPQTKQKAALHALVTSAPTGSPVGSKVWQRDSRNNGRQKGRTVIGESKTSFCCVPTASLATDIHLWAIQP